MLKRGNGDTGSLDRSVEVGRVIVQLQIDLVFGIAGLLDLAACNFNSISILVVLLQFENFFTAWQRVILPGPWEFSVIADMKLSRSVRATNY
jgi:hypothetical protein